MLSRLLFWRKRRALVPVVRLSGVIAAGGGLRRGISLEAVEPQLKKAFSIKSARAVALIINSPGGSPVQSALIGQRVRDLARKASRAIGRYIQNAIYPIRIIAIDGDVLTLGQGGKTIERGERYSLIRLGERLYDPYTKESLGYQETAVGTVMITTVRAKQSKAEIETLNGADIAALTGYEYVVRPIEPAADAEMEAARERGKKAKDQVKSLKDKFDE